MGNGMNKVMPGLYVGNYRDSKDASQLQKFNITHILSIHDTAKRVYPEKHYLCVLASDTPNQNLSQYFALCNDFIHAARLRNGNVLIHCLAGMSRSVTITIAYIMTVTNLSWKDALKVVRVARAVANPNSGFQKQLQEFENTKLTEVRAIVARQQRQLRERKRLKERFPSMALVEIDERHCRMMLKSYQKLIVSKHLCEHNCPRGDVCPTGICHLQHRKVLRKNSSVSVCSIKKSAVDTPSTSRAVRQETIERPQSGPAVLMTSLASRRLTSVQSLPDLNEPDRPQIMSAPPTPKHGCMHRQDLFQRAPLVDLDKLMGL